MSHRVMIALVLLVVIILRPGIARASGDWSHVNGDEEGRCFLDLPLTGRYLDWAHTLRSVELESASGKILAADVDGDARQEMIGETEDGKAIWLVKFGEQTAREVVSMETADLSISLDCLADLNNDGANEILYSVHNPDGSIAFEAYDAFEDRQFLTIPLGPEVGDERIHSAIDVDFDGSSELVTIGMSPSDESGIFSVFDMDGTLSYRSPDLTGVVTDSSLVVLREPEFQETWFFLAVNPRASAPGNDPSNASIHAFLMMEGGLVYPGWSKPLRVDLAVQRIAVGTDDDGRRVLVFATRRRSESLTTVQDNYVTLLDVLNGDILTQYPLGKPDCIDLALTDTDEDEGNEVLLLDSDAVIHKLDFTTKSDRNMSLVYSTMIVGACNMYRDPWPDVALVQRFGNLSVISTLSDTLDPMGMRGSFTVPGRLVGRPIFADTDGNGYGEVLFVGDDGTPKAHRLSFRDPSPLDIPSAVTPTPTLSVPSSVSETREYP